MGILTVIAYHRPKNLIHVVINNGAHETVGGQPTVAGGIRLSDVARACGYPYAVTVVDEQDLDKELWIAKHGPMVHGQGGGLFPCIVRALHKPYSSFLPA